jgi:hypothetical protein
MLYLFLSLFIATLLVALATCACVIYDLSERLNTLRAWRAVDLMTITKLKTAFGFAANELAYITKGMKNELAGSRYMDARSTLDHLDFLKGQIDEVNATLEPRSCNGCRLYVAVYKPTEDEAESPDADPPEDKAPENPENDAEKEEEPGHPTPGV